MIKKIQTLILMGLCTFISPTVLASDGVVEINQTCATQLGCFSGDSAGFPILIDGSAGSSYRLTSDLTINVLNTNVITIEASGINIDLNGFTISCIYSSASCKNQGGVGTGIYSNLFEFRSILVKNGKVSSMGFKGLNLPTRSTVYGMEVHDNGSTGIQVGSGSIVRNNIVRVNGLYGIYGDSTGTAILVSENIVNYNSSIGIYTGGGSLITSNVLRGNNSDGIRTGAGSSVKNNTVSNNQGIGLNLNTKTLYLQNVVTGSIGANVSSGQDMGQNYCDSLNCN